MNRSSECELSIHWFLHASLNRFFDPRKYPYRCIYIHHYLDVHLYVYTSSVIEEHVGLGIHHLGLWHWRHICVRHTQPPSLHPSIREEMSRHRASMMHHHGRKLVSCLTVDGIHYGQGGADAADFWHAEKFGEEDSGVHLWSRGVDAVCVKKMPDGFVLEKRRMSRDGRRTSERNEWVRVQLTRITPVARVMWFRRMWIQSARGHRLTEICFVAGCRGE